MKKLILILMTMTLVVGCGGFHVANPNVPPVGAPPTFEDPYLIVDRVIVQIDGTANGTYARVKVKRFNIMDLILPQAIAYNGGVAPNATLTAITYNNPATVVGFTLNSTNLVAGSFTGDTLSFGNFAISGLDDNKLKVCPAAGEANNGNVKCNKAKIRIYSATGDANGVFQNTTDSYFIPLLVSGTPVGVGVANAAYVQTYTIAANKNRLRVADLTAQTANFPITMDFSNGGAGSYSANLIVEYVLIKE